MYSKKLKMYLQMWRVPLQECLLVHLRARLARSWDWVGPPLIEATWFLARNPVHSWPVSSLRLLRHLPLQQRKPKYHLCAKVLHNAPKQLQFTERPAPMYAQTHRSLKNVQRPQIPGSTTDPLVNVACQMPDARCETPNMPELPAARGFAKTARLCYLISAPCVSSEI